MYQTASLILFPRSDRLPKHTSQTAHPFTLGVHLLSQTTLAEIIGKKAIASFFRTERWWRWVS
ncbi:hypothetical protein [Limnospira fusiformis]|uniref:hypothetical protein n=1 Tax=Limnospira fusiformis TaxID=54297 RepID=UPI002AA16D48|nr:hypothetical protein [Limnospira fusiformis LS22]